MERRQILASRVTSPAEVASQRFDRPVIPGTSRYRQVPLIPHVVICDRERRRRIAKNDQDPTRPDRLDSFEYASVQHD